MLFLTEGIDCGIKWTIMTTNRKTSYGYLHCKLMFFSHDTNVVQRMICRTYGQLTCKIAVQLSYDII